MKKLLSLAGAVLLASGAAAQHDEHAHGSASAGYSHTSRLNVPAGDAPALELAVQERASGAYVLHLRTSGLRFSREHADAEHIPGEGHGHVYLNGEKIARVYGATYELAPLPPGVHEIEVGLFTNDHRAYAAGDWPVSARAVLRVLDTDERPAGGELRRIDLAIRDGQVDAAGSTVRVTEGDRLELRWSADARVIVHLHGYDLEAEVAPRAPALVRFDATLTGRFPVETHGGPRHRPLLFLEVHPR